MPPSLQSGSHVILTSALDRHFNRNLLNQFIASQDRNDVRKTHYFNGRYENIYLEERHAPLLAELKLEAKRLASEILDQPVRKMGCWFNAMGPGAETTLHSHDDDDELLSGVYYVCVPECSGELIIHDATGQHIHHTPSEGQWVFFSPGTPHEVSKNDSQQLRLSIAFNFC